MNDVHDTHLGDLVTAPAGSGKTVEMVRRYLHELRRGVPAKQIVAITFTRKAAAELVERLSRVLRFQAGLAGEIDDAELYLPCAPDAGTALEALESLPNAPVSTVDSFVHRLVQELLLDARYVLPDGGSRWLDGPLSPSGTAGQAFEEAARDALEALGDDGEVTAEARTLLAEVSLADAITDLAALARLEQASLAGNADLLEALGGASLTLDQAFWNVAKKELENVSAALVELHAWDRDPSRTPPGLPFVLTKRWGEKRECQDEKQGVYRKIATALGVKIPDRGLDVAMKVWEDLEWTDRAALERADAVRTAAWRLSRVARARALQQLATEAMADHGEILRVATTLCKDAASAPEGSPLASLRDRYQVLMVDELQDTNPEQLAFYEAFRGMSGKIRVFFVGDLRQSIFRFRDGDPHGWQDLLNGTPEDRRRELDTNYRSSALLVGFQKALFGNLHALGERGVDEVESVEPSPVAPEGRRDGEAASEPALVVDAEEDEDVHRLAIAAFSHRLGRAWQDPKRIPPGHVLPEGAPRTDSAGVLVRTWKTAEWAAAELHRHGIHARVTGDRSLLSGRPATDLRILLGALLDPTDEIAWMGMLKHPCVGVTDAALARLRPFGRLLALNAGSEVPSEEFGDGVPHEDRQRLDRTIPLLASARRRLGREPTALVLDEVVTQLGWRPTIEAGPEGSRGLAELELVLDLVRAAEAEGVDPHAVLVSLGDAEEHADDLPRVRLESEGPVVEITTVFSAKGLEYDHVCLLEVGKPGDVGVRRGKAIDIVRAGGKTILGVRIDPERALTPRRDPFTAFVAAIGKAEGREEGLRLLYVAVTRARHTLTLGLPPGDGQVRNIVSAIRAALGIDPKEKGRKGQPDVFLEMPQGMRVLRTRSESDAGLLRLPPQTPPPRELTPAVGRPRCAWTTAGTAWMRNPSSWADAQDAAERRRLVQSYRESVQVVAGSTAAPDLPWPEGAVLNERTQGDVVHGWLERWGLRDAPDPADARRYLEDRWRCDDDALAHGLCALGTHLLDALPGLRSLIEGAASLRFEVPILARVGGDALVGRADLVVEHGDGSVTVIDFKAGTHTAQILPNDEIDDDEADRSVRVPGLSRYAWQLEAYRRALTSAGRQVREVGLVYVRGPSWARWCS